MQMLVHYVFTVLLMYTQMIKREDFRVTIFSEQLNV